VQFADFNDWIHDKQQKSDPTFPAN
jgi:hypothetical protein